jgi:hypothetical protein
MLLGNTLPLPLKLLEAEFIAGIKSRGSHQASWVENAVICILRCVCGDCEYGIAIYIGHEDGLVRPVVEIALENTQRVDPEPFVAQATSDIDTVTERLREVERPDAFFLF